MSEYFNQCGKEFDCVKYPGVGPFSRTLLIELVNAVILIIAAVRVQVEDQGRVKHRHDSSRKPRFGFGAGYVINFLAAVGLTFCVPPLILFFAWNAVNTSVACQLQFTGFSFPLWSTFLAFVCILVNVGNEIRLCTRFSILRAAMSVYKHDPNNERPAVLITPVYKSAFLLPLVRQLREKEQQTAAHPVSDSQLRTRVIAVDTWRVAWREWAEENAVREHVYHFTEFRQQARNPHVFRLPVSDGEVEAIFAPFASYLPFCQDPGDNEHEQYQKLVIIVKEFYRVLRPGGTLSSYNLFWKSSMFVRAVKEAGGFENVETGKKWYFPTAFPCHLTTMTKSTTMRTPVPSSPRPEKKLELSSSPHEISSTPSAPSSAAHSYVHVQQSSTEHSHLLHSVAHEPKPKHLCVRLVAAAFGVCIYLVLTFLTWKYWCYFMLPMVTSLMTSNLTSYFIVSYFSISRVNLFCKRPEVTTAEAVVLLAKLLADMIMGLTILHVVFWVPSFAVDYGLNDVLSAQNIAYVNVGLNFVIFFGLARLAPYAIAYVKRQMKQAEDDMDEDVAAGVDSAEGVVEAPDGSNGAHFHGSDSKGLTREPLRGNN